MKELKQLPAIGVALLLIPSFVWSQVRPVYGSAKNRTTLAMGREGPTQLAGRTTRVSLDFPGGRQGKGTTLILRDHSTGYYFSIVSWDKDYTNRSLLDDFEAESRVGVTDKKLVVFTLRTGMLFAHESKDKAPSIDDAEAETLKWIAGHMTETEGRADRYGVIRIGDIVHFAPPGFLPDQPAGSAMRSFGPSGLLDLERENGFWALTVQGLYKAKWLIDDQYLGHAIVRVNQE